MTAQKIHQNLALVEGALRSFLDEPKRLTGPANNTRPKGPTSPEEQASFLQGFETRNENYKNFRDLSTQVNTRESGQLLADAAKAHDFKHSKHKTIGEFNHDQRTGFFATSFLLGSIDKLLKFEPNEIDTKNRLLDSFRSIGKNIFDSAKQAAGQSSSKIVDYIRSMIASQKFEHLADDRASQEALGIAI